MRNWKEDKLKSPAQLKKELSSVCMITGCGKPLTHTLGPGSSLLCREHQLEQREYGGLGRLDRPHTFHRKWKCVECGYNPLEDTRLAAIEDEMTKRRVGRYLIHGDHITRQVDGGDDTQENIQSLCFVCHAKKTILNEDFKKKSKK